MSSSDDFNLPSTLSPEVVVNTTDKLEPQERYKPGGYHQVNVGEICNDRYEVILKLGWRINSTAWLIRDTQFVLIFRALDNSEAHLHFLFRSQNLVAMKVLAAELSDKNECVLPIPRAFLYRCSNVFLSIFCTPFNSPLMNAMLFIEPERVSSTLVASESSHLRKIYKMKTH